tara:strand:+ start:66 stop:2366 length:2301 start_codon:yes stop_codon:yes gene_type:complete
MSILFDNPPPAIGCGDPGDPIDFACLFDGASYLDHTFDTGVQERYVLCGWFKPSKPDVTQTIISQRHEGVAAAHTWFGLEGGDTFRLFKRAFDGTTVNVDLSWVGARHDMAAPFHWHLAVDPSQPAADRFTLTVGLDVLEKQAGAIYSSDAQAELHFFIDDSPLRIGARHTSGASDYAQGYLSELHGVWMALPSADEFVYRNYHGAVVNKDYSGEHGEFGFHLDFADPLDIGKDVSGNGNHFTAIGLTVDNQVTDTPTNNFAVGNPLDAPAPSGRILSEGNTAWQPAHNPGEGHIASTMLIPAGKYYWEVLVETGAPFSPSTIVPAIGFAHRSVAVNEADGAANGLFHYHSNGNLVANPWGTDSGYPSWTVDDVISVAIDRENGDCWFAKNGVWISGDPVAGTDPAFTIPADWLDGLRASLQDSAANGAIKAKVNFGQFAFDYPVPDGFRTLSTSAMPCPAILNPDGYFTVRKVGDTTPLPWSPLVHKTLAVTKDRDGSTSWRGNDTVRGDGKAWACDVGGAEINEGANGVSWTTAGPVYGSAAQYQGNRITWFWRASPKAGFDIVEINHVNGTPSTVAHKAGGLIEYAWVVPLDGGDVREFHHRLAPGEFLRMNDYDYPLGVDAGWFSSTGNSVTLGASMTSGRYIAYLWRAVPQFSAFELYGGTGNADGEFLPLDFEARLHLFRRKNAAASCTAICADIETSNPAKRYTRLTLPNPESTEAGLELDIYSNGTKPRGLAAAMNYNGHTYLTADWARTPGKFARAR